MTEKDKSELAGTFTISNAALSEALQKQYDLTAEDAQLIVSDPDAAQYATFVIQSSASTSQSFKVLDAALAKLKHAIAR